MNWQSGCLSYTGIVGDVEEFPWDGSSRSNDGVRGPEDKGGDGTEKFVREGDGRLSGGHNGSFVGGVTASSTAALARCRL